MLLNYIYLFVNFVSLLVMKKSLILSIIFFITVCFHSYSQLLINEYSAANYDSYQDNYGEYEDWFEIYNTTPTAIDISGYYISDKSNNPTKWQVPSSLTVPGLGGLLIYCSGRDEVTAGAAHTNFKITQTKGNEVLMLSDASGILKDSIRVLPNHKGHSTGRITGGSLIWGVFNPATPAAMNINAFSSYAPTPVFSIPSGYYTGSGQVIITSSNRNVTIYYTTDGSTPDNT